MRSNRKLGIVATIVTVLACFCPGTIIFLSSGIMMISPQRSGDNIALVVSILTMCLSLIMVIIPIGVGAYVFWPEKSSGYEEEDTVPPAL